MPCCLELRRAASEVVPGVQADAGVLEVAPPVLDRVGSVRLREAVELLRLRVVGALLGHLRHRPQLLADLLDQVVDRDGLLLERRRRRDEPEQVVTALRRDLGRPAAVEQGVVDVVDLDLDVVLLPPLLDVRVVEPLVVGRHEVSPGHDPKIACELLVREPQRPVETERLVAEAAEHADGEGRSGALPEQITAGQCRARLRELVGCVWHAYPSFRNGCYLKAPPVKPLMKRSRKAL